MEEALGVRYWLTRTKNHTHQLASRCVGLVRYADDFVVFCHTQEEAEQARATLTSWLTERGLQFSDEKTRIVNLDEGFDFLGFNVRQYKVTTSRSGYRLLIKPSKKSVQAIRRKLKDTFHRRHGHHVDRLIQDLNPVIRGWANYFRTGVSARIFNSLDDYLWTCQVRWVKSQHPTKTWRWRKRRYWGNYRNKAHRVFGHRDLQMLKFSWTPIKRHILVKRFASWDDPDLETYWDERKIREIDLWLTDFKKKVAKQQGYVCPVCKDHLLNGEDLHEHHLIRKCDGGGNDPRNYALVHYFCHQTAHADMRNHCS
jgi:RNA-directed DNA polymerase